MIDRFQYRCGFFAENIEKYDFGGYHPTHINDRLNDGRYEILNKLGDGSFSTVWLARDHLLHRTVSIKIVVAEQSNDENSELRIMQHIRMKGDPSHPGYKHVAQLLDFFRHTGVNGEHLCIVQEVLGPKVWDVADEWTPHRRLDGKLARAVSRQLLLAVDFLHCCGVAHGDIHTGNILFKIPEIDPSLPARLQAFAPHTTTIVKKNGAPIEESLPRYMVEAVYNVRDLEDRLTDIQLVDFGESFFFSNPPRSLTTPLSLHPPELVFLRPLNEAVDIWNLGCATYELVTGRPLFEAMFHDGELPNQFRKVIGEIPEQWSLDAMKDDIFKNRQPKFTGQGFEPLELDIRRHYFCDYDRDTLELDEEDIRELGHYLRKALVFEPKKRATPQELRSEAWISGKESRAASSVFEASYSGLVNSWWIFPAQIPE